MQTGIADGRLLPHAVIPGGVSGKRALRRWARGRRDAISAARRAASGASIDEALVSMDAFLRADALFAYLAIGSEVETRSIIEAAWARGTAVALPRCDVRAHTLSWHRVASFDELEAGAYGILEPCGLPQTQLDPGGFACPLAVVPGLAFDCAGYRLGYGGGYYDRFLLEFPGVSIGLCYGDLLVDSLEEAGARDPHDVSVSFVVTEHGTLAAAGSSRKTVFQHGDFFC